MVKRGRRIAMVPGGLILLLGTVLVARLDAVAPASLTRWAIIGDARVEESGVVDLLSADLTRDPGLELVERQEMRRVLEEQELAALGGAGAAAARIRIGGRLRADALAVLSVADVDGKPQLQAVLCDCAQGARLAVEAWPLPADGPPASAADIASLIRNTRIRFPAGVRTVIGVSPFVSQNLTHEFDQYQVAFCRLLQGVLATQPGTAVIEIEEARTLHDELAGVADSVAERRVPVMVEGEYAVVRDAPDGPLVALTVRLGVAGKAVQPFAEKRTALDKVGLYFTLDLGPAIMNALGAGGKGVPADAQFAALERSADRFAHLGGWREAIGLREAGLLLSPDSSATRRRAIGEYCREMSRGFTPSEALQLEAECRRRIGLWSVARGHVEYLVHNRMLDHGEACDTVYALGRAVLQVRAGHAPLLKELEKEKKEFLIREFVPTRDLGGKRESREGGLHQVFLQLMFTRFDGNFLDDADLDAALRLVRQFKPEDGFSSQYWVHLLTSPDRFDATKHQAFCRALIALPNPGLVACGRYADLRRRYGLIKGMGQVTPELLWETESIQAELRAAGAMDFYMDSATSSLLAVMKNDLKQQGKMASPQPPSVPVRPPAAPVADDPGTGRLRFSKLDLRVRAAKADPVALEGSRWRAPGGLSSVQAVANCGDFDVMWGRSCLLYLRQGDVMDAAIAGTDDPILDVRWDGAQLWIATERAGIHVRDRQGNVTHRIGGDEGLPPSNRGVLLHPIEPGRMLALGSLGLHARAWAAVLDICGERGAVNVFYTARRVVTDADRVGGHAADPDVVFSPHWTHEFDDGIGDGTRTILVGRYTPTMDGRRRPLSIELPSLKVSLSDWELGAADHCTSAAYASLAGDLLEVGDFNVLWWKPSGQTWPNGEQWQQWCVPRNREGVQNGGLSKVFLRHQGWLYVPGLMWFRLDPARKCQEQLTPDRLKSPYADLRSFGVSAHHGLLAWTHGGPYYRVDVEEPDEP